MPPKKALKKLAGKRPEEHLEPHKPHVHEVGEDDDRKHHKKDKKHHEKKHHEKKRKEEKDLRRAYEHLGRLNALEKLLAGRAVTQIRTLTDLAQQALVDDDAKAAADLLRAAEHLAFGSLAQTARATRLSEALEAALNAELEHLAEKAAEHWAKREDERPPEIVAVYGSMQAIAEASRVKGAYRRALEFARGAEALAHVRTRPADGPEMLYEGEDAGTAIDVME